MHPAQIQTRQALLLASRIIAAHFPAWRDRRIWLRGRADYLLRHFRDASRSRALITEHGPSALLERVQELAEACKTAAGKIVVIQATLARPAESRDHPVGAWYWFPLAIYLDDGKAQLSSLFSAEIR